MKRWIGLLCLFSLYSTGSSAADTEPVTFSVLTYNVNIKDSERLQRNLPIIGEKLDAFAIAGIQGCFTSCDLLLDAAHHPHKFYFDQRPSPWNRVNSGLASLSQFPLIEVKKLYFKAQADVTSEKASRGILLMRYDVNGHILDVYNMHLQNGVAQLETTARILQTAELVDFIINESPSDHLVILHGDFDMGASRQLVKAKLKLQEPASDLYDLSVGVATNRMLFRSGSNTVFKPIAWEDESGVFIDAAGQPLSDDAPIAVQFMVE